jgi:hypothetical protein
LNLGCGDEFVKHQDIKDQGHLVYDSVKIHYTNRTSDRERILNILYANHLSHTGTAHSSPNLNYIQNSNMPYKQFHITEQPGCHHYNVTTTATTDNKQHLFLENSPFDNTQPDLRMHLGPDTTGPIIGTSKYKRFSQDCQISLEEDFDNRDSNWVNTTLSKKGYLSPSYVFQAHLYGELGRFSWKKTHSMGSHATPLGNLKLVDESSDDVLAVFSSESYSLVPGCVEMCGEFGEEFDRLALLTGVSVREKQRRAQSRSMRHGKDYVFTAGAAGVGMGMGMGGGS